MHCSPLAKATAQSSQHRTCSNHEQTQSIVKMNNKMAKLLATENSNRFRFQVDDSVSVGPPGNVFLFGGVGHAAAISAIKAVTDRELLWSSAQFSSFARRGDILDIDVHVSASGRHTTQASAIVRLGDSLVLRVAAACGDRPAQPSHQWTLMPDMPSPQECVEWPIWPKQEGGFNKRMELRLAPGSPGTRERTGSLETTGNLRIWTRFRDSTPIDVAALAILGDLIPAGVASAFGRKGGGNSLDNSLRVCAVVPTQWVLCDIQIDSVQRGFAHGAARLFAQDGTLMAVASQTIIVRFLED